VRAAADRGLKGKYTGDWATTAPWIMSTWYTYEIYHRAVLSGGEPLSCERYKRKEKKDNGWIQFQMFATRCALHSTLRDANRYRGHICALGMGPTPSSPRSVCVCMTLSRADTVCDATSCCTGRGGKLSHVLATCSTSSR
jgi:hypothetical protein